jgi:hypothetical protein
VGTQTQTLDTAVVTLQWYRINGGYDIDLGPFSRSSTFTIKPGLSLISGSDSIGNATVDWKVDLKGNLGITGVHYDTPIGRIGGAYRTDIFNGNASGTLELGSITLQVSVGVNGVTYTGPGDDFYEEYLKDYVDAHVIGRYRWMARAAMDVYAVASQWGPYAYAHASAAIADVARDFANAIAEGYGVVAAGIGTAIDQIENFFGSVSSNLKDSFEDAFDV